MRQKLLAFFLCTLFFIPLTTVHAEEEPLYIVSFKEHIDTQTIDSSGATLIDTLNHSPIAIVRADEQAVLTLEHAPTIEAIEKNNRVTIAAEQVDWGVDALKAPAAWATGYTGSGVKVAIIDTGVGPHEDLKVIESKSFIENEPSGTDFNGHGTHIAGIIGALHNGIGVKGIAPGAKLYSFKVFDKKGHGATHNVIRAIDWATERNVDIINLSLTSEVASTAYEKVINRAYEEGILIVGASGNETEKEATIDNVKYPAKFKNVIAVSSVNWDGNRGYFSSIGPAVEVVAPGVSIYSTHLENSYKYLQGTSMSTAFVTGYLALLKEAYPQLTNVQLRKIMIDDAVDLGPKGRDAIFGYGRIQSSAYNLPLYEYPAQKNPAIALVFSHEGILGHVDDTVKLEVSALLEDGEIVDVSKFAKWTVKNPEIASSRGGRIDLHREGETALQVTYGGLSDQVAVKVAPGSTSPADKSMLFTDLPKDESATEAIREIHKKHIINGYEDQTFRPREPILRQHVAAMITRTVELEAKVPFKPFLDVKMSAPYFYEITKTQQAKIFTGDQNKFQPQRFLTRAQMAKILVETFHLPKATTAHPFPDVKEAHWANLYIDTLYETGITTGNNGLYNPEAYVTRKQFAVFIHRILNYSELTEVNRNAT